MKDYTDSYRCYKDTGVGFDAEKGAEYALSDNANFGYLLDNMTDGKLKPMKTKIGISR